MKLEAPFPFLLELNAAAAVASALVGGTPFPASVPFLQPVDFLFLLERLCVPRVELRFQQERLCVLRVDRFLLERRFVPQVDRFLLVQRLVLQVERLFYRFYVTSALLSVGP